MTAATHSTTAVVRNGRLRRAMRPAYGEGARRESHRDTPRRCANLRKSDQARPTPPDHDGAMSTSSDTFAAFVDQLVSAMQDDEAGELTGDELASRVGFSRFHFDRMIRSVAAEPPAAFRRRILL